MLNVMGIVLCLLAGQGTAVDREALKGLQGKWAVASMEHGGKHSKPADLAALTLEIDGTRFTARDGVDTKEDAKVIALQARAKPATIDLQITAGTDLDKVIRGIWKRDGDALTVCVAEPAKERPKAFAAREGTGHTLFVFRRSGKPGGG